MKQPTLEQLLGAMEPVVRRTMLRRFNSDCCIATCKIMQTIFAEYGFRAEPFPVSVYIHNAKQFELIKNGTLPDSGEEREALGAWAVGLVAGGKVPNGRQGFGGHLVLHVEGMLIDASLQQADRPERAITLPPLLAVPAEPGFFGRRAKGQQMAGIVNGCMVVFKRIENEGWRSAPNWKEAYAGSYQTYVDVMKELIKTL